MCSGKRKGKKTHAELAEMDACVSVCVREIEKCRSKRGFPQLGKPSHHRKKKIILQKSLK